MYGTVLKSQRTRKRVKKVSKSAFGDHFDTFFDPPSRLGLWRLLCIGIAIVTQELERSLQFRLLESPSFHPPIATDNVSTHSTLVSGVGVGLVAEAEMITRDRGTRGRG